jgi:hypothetical protein
LHFGRWTHTVLYAFAGFSDGAFPQAEVVFDKDGNLYGMTNYGGSGGPNCFGSPCGTVFELMPTPAGPWTHTGELAGDLHVFFDLRDVVAADDVRQPLIRCSQRLYSSRRTCPQTSLGTPLL